jgi:hypothetical protein
MKCVIIYYNVCAVMYAYEDTLLELSEVDVYRVRQTKLKFHKISQKKPI